MAPYKCIYKCIYGHNQKCITIVMHFCQNVYMAICICGQKVLMLRDLSLLGGTRLAPSGDCIAQFFYALNIYSHIHIYNSNYDNEHFSLYI